MERESRTMARAAHRLCDRARMGFGISLIVDNPRPKAVECRLEPDIQAGRCADGPTFQYERRMLHGSGFVFRARGRVALSADMRRRDAHRERFWWERGTRLGDS